MFLTKGGAVVSGVEANLQECYPCLWVSKPPGMGCDHCLSLWLTFEANWQLVSENSPLFQPCYF